MYTGRFAPTPSGRLHLGSLLTLTGAYLRAKSQHGSCLLRIEDLDKDRCSAENTLMLHRDLDLLGFHFDGETITQSQSPRQELYAEAIARLQAQGLCYGCSCSRASRKLGQCRCYLKPPGKDIPQTLCFMAPSPFSPEFEDLHLGTLRVESAGRSCILRRRDGIIAYNLACVVDDHYSAVTEVVRGADLIADTPLQNALYQALGWRSPAYVHLPLLLQPDGLKYSKQNHARAVLEAVDSPQQALLLSLRLLGQDLQGLSEDLSCSQILALSEKRFDLGKVPAAPVTCTY